MGLHTAVRLLLDTKHNEALKGDSPRPIPNRRRRSARESSVHPNFVKGKMLKKKKKKKKKRELLLPLFAPQKSKK